MQVEGGQGRVQNAPEADECTGQQVRRQHSRWGVGAGWEAGPGRAALGSEQGLLSAGLRGCPRATAGLVFVKPRPCRLLHLPFASPLLPGQRLVLGADS